MYENLYGVGSPVVGRGRIYCVEARCKVKVPIWARSEEEAEVLFREGAGDTASMVDQGAFEILEITEAEA